MKDLQAYFTIQEVMISCDMRSKNSMPQLKKSKYPAGMTKKQCIEKFVAEAPHNDYEWDVQCLPEGGVIVAFSTECKFFFSMDEYRDLCKRVNDVRDAYFKSLKFQEDETN